MTQLSYGDAMCAAREREIDEDEAYAARLEMVEGVEKLRLKTEFFQACEAGPLAIVETPAWNHTSTSALPDVIDDLCAGKNDYAQQLIKLLALAMKSTDMGVRFTSQALVARMGEEYAQFHAADAAVARLK